MDVNNHIRGSHLPLQGNARPEGRTGGSVTRIDSSHELNRASRSGTSRTGDVASLADQVSQFPEVRDNVVAEATNRLASGWYLTDSAADEAADAILG